MNSLELAPWLILIGEAADAQCACWKISQTGQSAVALFSTRAHAEQYASQHCPATFSLLQLDENALLRVLTDCYRQGARHAALDPTDCSARQLFVLRDVLLAARQQLQDRRNSAATTS